MDEPLYDRLVGRLIPTAPPAMVAAPPGWESIIRRLADQLDEAWPDWRLFQVKEKMGSLEVYLEPPPGGGVPDAAKAAIQAAEAEAAVTCQRCGTTDGVERRSEAGVVATLCGPCRRAIRWAH